MKASGSFHILLADDDEDDQEMLKEALMAEMPGVEVKTVGNGQDALSYLKDCPRQGLPQLIVLDYKMPLLNGAETAQRLTDDPRYSAIPVVVWSTSNQPQYRENSLKSGALRYFVKPDSRRDLMSMAQTMLTLGQRDG